MGFGMIDKLKAQIKEKMVQISQQGIDISTKQRLDTEKKDLDNKLQSALNGNKAAGEEEQMMGLSVQKEIKPSTSKFTE